MKELKVTHVMHFANRPHLTYTLGDTDYISLRPLVDQIGLDWRTQKQKLLDDDAVLFYGTLLLKDGEILQAPCKYDLKNGISASLGSEEPQKIATFCTEDAQKDTVFIRLRRVQMYIARISIGQVHSQGNQSSAEYLLSLHEEWADALHDYETHGIAVKSTHAKMKTDDIKNLVAISKAKTATESVEDRKILGSVMQELAEKLGHPYQADLLED